MHCRTLPAKKERLLTPLLTSSEPVVKKPGAGVPLAESISQMAPFVPGNKRVFAVLKQSNSPSSLFKCCKRTSTGSTMVETVTHLPGLIHAFINHAGTSAAIDTRTVKYRNKIIITET